MIKKPLTHNLLTHIPHSEIGDFKKINITKEMLKLVERKRVCL